MLDQLQNPERILTIPTNILEIITREPKSTSLYTKPLDNIDCKRYGHKRKRIPDDLIYDKIPLIMFPIIYKEFQIFQKLLTKDNVNLQSSFGMTPLHIAIYTRAPKIFIKTLLNMGACPNIRNIRYHTSLMYASSYSLRITRMILYQNSQLDPDNFESPLLFVLQQRRPSIKIIKELLKYGFSANEKFQVSITEASGIFTTPMHIMLDIKNILPIMKVLVNGGGLVNNIDYAGENMLPIVIRNHDNPRLVRYLLESGIEITNTYIIRQSKMVKKFNRDKIYTLLELSLVPGHSLDRHPDFFVKIRDFMSDNF